MPRIRRIQSSFNAGVLDPRLGARIDVRAYNNGAENLDNALCLPQGGAARRPGMKYIDAIEIPSDRVTGQTITAPNGGTTANANDNDSSTLLTTTTAIGTTANYMVVQYDLGTAQTIEFADVVGIKLSAGSNAADFAIYYSSDASTWFAVPNTSMEIDTTARDFRRNIGISARYWAVRRGSLAEDEGAAVMSLGEFSLFTGRAASDARLIPFSFNTEQNYMIAIAGGGGFGSMLVYKDDVLLAQFPIEYLSTQIDTINWTQSADTLIITHKNIAPKRIVRDTTSEGLWVIDDVPLTNIPQYDFGSGAEDTWSTTRGWPLTVTFFEGRMVFGGSKGRPQGLWMSVTNDFYNFNVGTGQPDEAIVGALDTDQVNEIRNVVPGRTLEIFTSGGEFIIPTTPVLPENFSVVRQTRYGSAAVRTASIDGATLYVQRNGQGFREFLFSFAEDSHVSNSVSQLSSHLINTPVDIDAVAGTQTTETNYVYMVNTAGDVVVLNTLREQEIAAWSGPWTTEAGLFKRVGVLDFDTYFLVERTIDGDTVYYLEKLDDDLCTDSAVYSASHSSATVTGADHLEGETVRVKLGGAIQPNAVVSGGSFTLERTPDAETLEYGLDFNPTIKTMPVNDGFQDGPTLNREKRIVRATINRYQSLGVFVNGERLPDRQLDDDTFDDVPTPSDETVEIYLHGWSQKAQVTITQEDPVPMTILALDLEVSA